MANEVIVPENVLESDINEFRASSPSQLGLFFNKDRYQKHLSHTIELYDVMPKYFFGNQMREKGKSYEYLPEIVREFVHRKEHYTISIRPARITKNGRDIDIYPGQREELVEDAIRKIAIDREGVFLDGNLGVPFTLYQVQQELSKNGHGYNLNEIKEALLICHECNIKVISKSGEIQVSSSIFPALGLATRKEFGKRAFVQFSPLVTTSINQGTYRQINFSKYMKHSLSLSRWLHKRMSHHFTQAGKNEVYSIHLSTIVSGSGMKQYSRIGDCKKQIHLALKQLVKNEVLAAFDDTKHSKIIYSEKRKNKIEDIKFQLIPHPSFINEIISANQKQKVSKFLK
ncbi:hypothetical protein HOH45_01545 [bacterium]|jgi:hypothetical protein|nr:hypothetical protein [bacterium]